MTILSHAWTLPADIDSVAAAELQELERRVATYRGNRPPLDVAGKTIIVVDDGLATGAMMRAALIALRRSGPARLVVAVPVGAPDSCRRIEDDADEVVCLARPDPFQAVGLWYRDFPQTSDDEVRDLLDKAESFGRRA
ncbi:phosphoribosyltransferase [Aromatoleum sp.]|uniref:phosphoribosyltransferase n=1 Tax=Aromatoleum sp. TaxID=2307007 RepID=UPI002FCB6F41